MTHTREMASLWRSWRELRIPVRTVVMIPSWTNISILTVLKRRHTTITTIPTPRAVRVSTNCSLLILFPLPRMSLLESKRLAFPRTIKGMLFLFSLMSSPLISPNLSKVTLLNQTYSNQPSTKYRPSFSLSISFVVVPWTSPLSQRELLTLLESYLTPLPSLSMNPRKAMQWSLQSLSPDAQVHTRGPCQHFFTSTTIPIVPLPHTTKEFRTTKEDRVPWIYFLFLLFLCSSYASRHSSFSPFPSC